MSPGITGLWRVGGKSRSMDFEKVVKLDTKYITEYGSGFANSGADYGMGGIGEGWGNVTGRMDLKQGIKRLLSPAMKLRHGLWGGKNTYIAKGVKILRPRRIELGKNVSIRSYATVICVSAKAQIVLESGVDIGMFSRITAALKIHLGRNVLLGPNVFISDHNHKYVDILQPVTSQGIEVPDLVQKAGEVYIGDETWIGTNVVIVGAAYIGKHCIIGANSVVTHNIPDYSVAVGNPCNVIKKYDFLNKQWVRMNTKLLEGHKAENIEIEKEHKLDG